MRRLIQAIGVVTLVCVFLALEHENQTRWLKANPGPWRLVLPNPHLRNGIIESEYHEFRWTPPANWYIEEWRYCV